VEGQTSVIREHLKKDHGDEYREMVCAKKLKGWADIQVGQSRMVTSMKVDREAFSLDGFYQRLI
jgi:hypothetical protein